MRERIFPPLLPIKENFVEDEEMHSDFMDFEPNFDVLCNLVSILPAEYDIVSEIKDTNDDLNPEDIANHMAMCYYVTNYGCVEEQQVMFENPNGSMKSHLKPLFIQARFDNIGVNKVLVDGGATVNLMPSSLLKNIGKFDTDLKPYNIVF